MSADTIHVRGVGHLRYVVDGVNPYATSIVVPRLVNEEGRIMAWYRDGQLYTSELLGPVEKGRVRAAFFARLDQDGRL